MFHGRFSFGLNSSHVQLAMQVSMFLDIYQPNIELFDTEVNNSNLEMQ